MEDFKNTRRVIQEEVEKKDPLQALHNLQIDKDDMKRMQFNVRRTRSDRRKIARSNKFSWKLYQLIEKEVERRAESNLSIFTGQPL